MHKTGHISSESGVWRSNSCQVRTQGHQRRRARVSPMPNAIRLAIKEAVEEQEEPEFCPRANAHTCLT